MSCPQEDHRVGALALHRTARSESQRCSSRRVSDPGYLFEQVPGPAELSSGGYPREKFDVDDHTPGAADRVNEAVLRLVNAQGMLTYCLDGRLDDYEALSGAAALIGDAIRWLTEDE